MEEKDCKFGQNAVSETNEQKVEFSENLLDQNKTKQKNQDSLLEQKEFLPYGVGPVIDCEIDDDNDEPDYSTYARRRPKNLKLRRQKKKRRFLPYGVGPVIDCEIDDDSDEPDYLSYSVVPKSNLFGDSSSSKDAVP
ncbi:uncharacterized protein LOC113558836 [Rhopalosiphum maidis]|uniref:uncharacterized protein LOC113558836 n=1 Tax=Rhopalosiphum maidis TaxID=43146 RepID=UPI000EFDE685|nr:uncharacterized protein LOC113558836 [Rhopalosiphum maidis]XP_026820206.1 uncharacterized protein LOC113558836 [Rhopalosiphum maidis]XP_026820208.1 uncharacterized protein LOC113558836 [Rhopalosiphum maidis]